MKQRNKLTKKQQAAQLGISGIEDMETAIANKSHYTSKAKPTKDSMKGKIKVKNEPKAKPSYAKLESKTNRLKQDALAHRVELAKIKASLSTAEGLIYGKDKYINDQENDMAELIEQARLNKNMTRKLDETKESVIYWQESSNQAWDYISKIKSDIANIVSIQKARDGFRKDRLYLFGFSVISSIALIGTNIGWFYYG